MTDKEYVDFLTKCANIPYEDYSWLKDHCYRTLKRPCSPNTRNEHLAILDLIREHEERQWISVSERLPEDSGEYLVSLIDEYDENYEAVGVAWFAHKKDYDIKESEWRELAIDETVIAWMPKPKPYEPQERNDKE